MKPKHDHKLRRSSTQPAPYRAHSRWSQYKIHNLSTPSDWSLEGETSASHFQFTSPSTEEFTTASRVVIDQPDMLEFLGELRNAIQELLPEFNVTSRTRISQSCEEEYGIETSVAIIAMVDSECPIDRLAATSEEVDDLIARHRSANVRSAVVVVFDRRA